jgi:hypothetical protein
LIRIGLWMQPIIALNAPRGAGRNYKGAPYSGIACNQREDIAARPT